MFEGEIYLDTIRQPPYGLQQRPTPYYLNVIKVNDLACRYTPFPPHILWV